MAKDQFYHSGMPNDFDGNCSTCPFLNLENFTCKETETEVTNYVVYGGINHNCPFITK